MQPTLFRCVALSSVLFGALALSACSQRPYIPVADETLKPTAKGNFDFVFVAEGERIPRFETVFIEPAEVTLSDYWLRDHRGDYTDRDLERIHTEYARLLNEALKEGLTERTGVTVTTNRAEAQIVFTPTLRDLNIYGPDLSVPGITRHYTQDAGTATFDLVLHRPDGHPIAQFVDHREADGMMANQLEWTTRGSNYRHFRQLMDRWTGNLAQYLLIGGAVPSAEAP
ncbi:DUF3313 family protein [Marinimicrobium agarilyticum]|uniref:DUF3313 family protein n=1 Tax=Marinimicrobium agarilyticum TaxID=306546 RepID=UPI0003F7573D|nr:DUF3313 family protein [Marinimicrobium agarilyticum]